MYATVSLEAEKTAILQCFAKIGMNIYSYEKPDTFLIENAWKFWVLLSSHAATVRKLLSSWHTFSCVLEKHY